MSKTLSISQKIAFYTLSTILLLTVSGYIYLYVLPKGPKITATVPLKNGTNSFVMYAYKGSERKSIKVWTYKPRNWKDKDKIVFVMHGGGRNADDYLDAWIDIAKESNLLIVVPEFTNKFSKYVTNDYQEGNLFTFFGVKNSKDKWAYTVAENIFDHIKLVNNITNEHYAIFGHSAGGQFVHRMILLMPESRIKTAIAANAGFYTFPDKDTDYPYGLKKSQVTPNSIRQSFDKQLIILLCENDNDPELGTFRKTERAMRQGENRLERGSNFYKRASELASKNSLAFNWRIDTIKNVGHNYKKMSSNAVKYIIN